MTGSDDMHALQVAAECGVEEQRHRAQAEDRAGTAPRARASRDAAPTRRAWSDAAVEDQQIGAPRSAASHDAVLQPAEAFVDAGPRRTPATPARRARASGPCRRSRRRRTATADSGRADRRRAERADHHRVHDAHAHPADLGEDDRAGELEHRQELATHAFSVDGRTLSVGAIGENWLDVDDRRAIDRLDRSDAQARA